MWHSGLSIGVVTEGALVAAAARAQSLAWALLHAVGEVKGKKKRVYYLCISILEAEYCPCADRKRL